jgi:hypothetical protein
MDELRFRYQQGVIAPEVYKGLCNQFQFRDSMGHLWSPGATSSNWYRWDRTAWTPADPPGELFFADEALENTAAWQTTARAAHMPPAPTCACGEPLTGTPFCKKCGRPAPMPKPEQAQARPAICPNPACGAKIEAGQRFCGHCGRAVM